MPFPEIVVHIDDGDLACVRLRSQALHRSDHPIGCCPQLVAPNEIEKVTHVDDQQRRAATFLIALGRRWFA